MGGQIFLLVIGVSLIFWPRLFTAMGPKAHGRRLSLLRAGEPEAFFEERRALETWPPPKDSPVWRRILGGMMILTAAGLFFLDYTSRREAEVEHAAMIEARDAAEASRVAVETARVAVDRAAAGDAGSYREARSALDRAEVALAKSERLSSH